MAPPPPAPGTPVPPAAPEQIPETARAAYLESIRRTAAMVHDSDARSLVARAGLDILSLTWEDTGRFKGSAVGPNISDMTIQVAVENPETGRKDVTLMPVIRFPNFSDLTCDLDPSSFTLLVGNHEGKPLKRVALRELLEAPTCYMTDPNSWKGKKRTLLAPRDEKVLVSAQACFLPVPRQGMATFNPVVFNYQSFRGEPAVLAILATREGTSMTVIDNARDAFDATWNWGQRLFHNQNGQRASLTGQRISEFSADEATDTSEQGDTGADSALNVVLLIQVPLVQKERLGPTGMPYPPMAVFDANLRVNEGTQSDVEAAVIGHGDYEGPFTEVDGLAIQRDVRFPVRVTVQFYKATSNGVISEEDVRQIRAEIDRVYGNADMVGSLVTGGHTGRVTEYDGVKVQSADWWKRFWRRYEASTGVSRKEALDRLRRLLGDDVASAPVSELYLRDALRGS